MGREETVRQLLAGLEDKLDRLADQTAADGQQALVSLSTFLPEHVERQDLLTLTHGATVWASFASEDSTVLTLGEVADLGGGEDFVVVASRWKALTHGAIRDALTQQTEGPISVFGRSFAEIDPAGPWSAFGNSRVVVPRLAIRRWRGQWVATVSSLVNGPPQVNSAEAKPSRSAGGSVSEKGFVAAVDNALVRICRGEVEKVVLTRTLHIDEAEIDPRHVLAYLDRNYPTTCRFAFARGATTFIGATPELLCAIQGKRLRTMALAGSVPPGHDPGAALEDPKLQHEHEIVASHIKKTLEPKSHSLTLRQRPELITLRNVAHLRTTIEAQLREEASVLAAVQWLHPTPAVGGYPLAAARSMIAELDGTDRGWYTGPIGWVDAAGDGACWIALRCALLTERGADLFAGAGIVQGSDPLAELAETNWKLAAIRSALPKPPDGFTASLRSQTASRC